MATRSEQRGRRRQAILGSAWDCFARNGFHATGMAELAAAAGLSPANLYRYFPSKQAIVGAIVQQARVEFLAEVERLAAEPDALRAILEILRYCVEHAADPASARLWLEILAEAGREGPIRRDFLPFDQQSLEPLATLVTRGATEGSIAADLDPRMTAQWLTALLDGVVARQVMEPDLDLRLWVERMEVLVRRALAPPRPAARKHGGTARRRPR